MQGRFKKLALADYLALCVQRVYEFPANHSASAVVLAAVAYAS